MIKFNINFIDEWEGETLYAKIDDQIFFTQSYNWCEKLIPWYCKKYNINVCGRDDISDTMAFPVLFVGEHDQESLKLTVGSNLKKKPCDASWGIDDVQIYIR
jgi:hypothetical protein